MLHYGTGCPHPWLKSKITKAITLIQDWLEQTKGRVYVSISGGKDSLVVAHLVRQVFPECPLVWVNQGESAEWPDCVELLHHLRQQGWNIVELCPPRGLWQLYLELGVPLDGRMTTPLDQQINERLMYAPLREYQELNGCKGFAWGIRKQESRGRRQYLLSKGLLYQRKDTLWVCSPVGYWSTQDVWAYIDQEGLPYPAIYDLYGRFEFRNGPPIGTTGTNWGRLALLRQRCPHIWQQFVERFPEIQYYA